MCGSAVEAPVSAQPGSACEHLGSEPVCEVSALVDQTKEEAVTHRQDDKVSETDGVVMVGLQQCHVTWTLSP